VTAQLHLGASWRIGIDEGASPGLVTSGLYRFCRNPIFLALLVTLSGYTLMLPTRLSLGLLLGAYIGVRQQVAAEEAYLLRTYGESYREYARRVGRFLPGLGRFR
jgi:protein-S-isoprenylcysteine O-methyltransferase Ste14